LRLRRRPSFVSGMPNLPIAAIPISVAVASLLALV
jgi:hypothetical protein